MNHKLGVDYIKDKLLNITKTTSLVTGVILLYGLIFYMVFVQAFPYDEELHEQARIARENAEIRKELLKEHGLVED